MRRFIPTIITGVFALMALSCSQANAQSAEIAALRDSLDAVQYVIPVQPQMGRMKVITIRTQEDWDALGEMLKAELKRGERNIEVRVVGKGLVIPVQPKTISSLNYPDANIRIDGSHALMVAEGVTFKRNQGIAVTKNGQRFWCVPYTEFGLNDLVTDWRGNEVPMRDEVKQVTGDIEKVSGFKFQDTGKSRIGELENYTNDIWRFQVELPNLSEEECKDFYVLMTRDWTSARHRVVKVQDGWLYYHLDSEDLHSDRDPNVDWKQYRVRPRYWLINCPVSEGLHTANGMMYVPWQYKEVRVNKGGVLFHMGYCKLNVLEITGFKLNGIGGKTPIGIYNSKFTTGAFIHDNTFTRLSSLAISTANNENVVIVNNTINGTREQAIAAGGTNTTICGNRLKKIGWMLNTRAITGGGDGLHICDNVIEDFNYSAIAVGSRAATATAGKLSFVIERNVIRLSEEYAANYITNCLSDGGAIYTGPQCTRGIIRYNVIENIKGVHDNRGIFLDDGTKNQAVYGNLIIDTDNSYDIDLRLCSTFATDIPDHNTGNSVFQNILTGGYRFQDKGEGSRCIGGENLLLGIGRSQKKVVELRAGNPDTTVPGTSVKNGRVVFPKRYEGLLDSVRVNDFVKQYITIK